MYKLNFLFFFLLSSLAISKNSGINIERLTFNDDVSSIQKVIIINTYGDIRIKQTKQDKLTFHAVSQFTKKYQAQLVSEIENNTLLLKVQYTNIPPPDSKVRVDAAIILPKHLNLEIQIDKGNLSTGHLKNKIKVTSTQSNLLVKSENSVNLFTKIGDIHLILQPHKKPKTMELKTYSGNVQVDFAKKQIPSAHIITGSIVTSNSIQFLQNQSKKNRTMMYNPEKSFDTIIVQTDTGGIKFVQY